MLSMTFIAIMLVAIAMCIIQMSTIYTRGETLRAVNQASRTVVEDMQRTFADANESSIVVRTDYSRVCTGSYTYVWNVVGSEKENNTYVTIAGQPTPPAIRFVRIVDNGGAYCNNATSDTSLPSVNKKIPQGATTQPVEFLQEGDRSLAIHKFDISDMSLSPSAPLSRQKMLTISMLVGTDNSGAIESTAGGDRKCRPPADMGSDVNYCAVNELSFTVRIGVR
jgi:hypothetical protein